MSHTVYLADWLKSQSLRPGMSPVLAMLGAVERGVSLSVIEELAREKDFVLELHELEQTLRQQVSLFHALAGTEAVALPSATLRLVSELKRWQADLTRAFALAPDAAKYTALIVIVERAGLNATTFLDLIPGLLWLQVCAGQLDLRVIFNVFRAEREVRPARHEARVQAWHRGRKTAVREALTEAHIDAETVFELLGTPYGPVRGEVMTKIYDLIRDPERPTNFVDHVDELRLRARLAKRLLDERHLILE